jgi:hypothetical protein
MPCYATKEKNIQGCNKRIINHNYLRYTNIFFVIKTLLKNMSYQTQKSLEIKKIFNKFGINTMKGKKLRLSKLK